MKSKNFWYLFLLIFCGFIYDCIWILINLDLLETEIGYKGPYHNAIAKISFFTNGLGGINKCCLAILFSQNINGIIDNNIIYLILINLFVF